MGRALELAEINMLHSFSNRKQRSNFRNETIGPLKRGEWRDLNQAQGVSSAVISRILTGEMTLSTFKAQIVNQHVAEMQSELSNFDQCVQFI